MKLSSCRVVVGVALILMGWSDTASAQSPDPWRVAGWGWETYSLSSAFSYGGYWGAHYGGARGILSGAAPHYGNYGGWYARHYVIGTAPWPAWDGALNYTWDERYSPSPWNYDGVSHLITHPKEDVNVYVPDGAGPYVPPNFGPPPGSSSLVVPYAAPAPPSPPASAPVNRNALPTDEPPQPPTS